MSERRHATSSLVFSSLLAACVGPHTTTSPRPACAPPAPIAWSIEGLALEERCRSGAAGERCEIIGVDRDGTIVERTALFLRAGARPPEELARIAEDTLLRHRGGEPVLPETDPTTLRTPAGGSLVHPPRFEGTVLSFFTLASDESGVEALGEVRVDRASGRIERIPVIDLFARAATPTSIECVLRTECGCELGCARVGAIAMPEGYATWYRLLDGPESGLLLGRDDELATSSPVHFAECDRSCDLRPASDRCVLEGDACVRATTVAQP